MPDSTATTATVAEPTRTFTFNITQVNEDNCTNTWMYVYEYGSANIYLNTYIYIHLLRIHSCMLIYEHFYITISIHRYISINLQ
jgi:hypothetical protein